MEDKGVLFKSDMAEIIWSLFVEDREQGEAGPDFGKSKAYAILQITGLGEIDDLKDAERRFARSRSRRERIVPCVQYRENFCLSEDFLLMFSNAAVYRHAGCTRGGNFC